MTISRRNALVIVCIGLIAVLLIALNGTLGINVFGKAQAATPAACSGKVHYLANDVTGNRFGPPVTESSVAGQLKRLHQTRCQDPSQAVIGAYYEGLPGYRNLDSDQLTAKTEQLASDPSKWSKTIIALEANEKSLPKSDATMSGSYQTLYEIARGNAAPLIGQASPDRPSYEVLRIGKFNYKLDCHFQPVQKHFPKIRHFPKPHPTPTPTPTHHKPMCTEYNIPVPPNGLCPKNPAKDPQSQGNVPTQVTKNGPSGDNGTEVNQPPTKPVDSGNGIPPGGTPRQTPSPAPTHSGSDNPGQPTSPPETEPAVSASPTSSGGVGTHCPDGGTNC